jgi:long-chain acyl-CoA synthetase
MTGSEGTSIVAAVRAAAGRVPERTALVGAEQTVTHGQLNGQAAAAAAWISEQAQGDIVGLLLPNHPAFAWAFLGAQWAGKTVAVVPTLAPPPLLKLMAAQAGLQTVITTGKLAPPLGEAGVRALLVEEMPGKPTREFSPVARSAEAAVLLYTSGTTGRPKTVALSDANILSNIEGSCLAAGFTQDEVMLAILPLFHSYGLTVTLLLPLILGGTVVLQERFIPRRVLQAIEDNRVTAVVAVPSQYRVLVKEPTQIDSSSLRLCIAGAERLSEKVGVEFESRFGCPILQGYGATEASPVISLNPPDASRPHTVGKALPNVRVIIREDGRELPAGETGEIWVEGPSVMLGYYKNPEATAEKISNGALRTGDRGFLDEDGYLHIAGRADDLIKIAGEKIYPAEVEQALEQIEGVEEAAVLGLPDEKHGTILCACVQLHPGTQLTEGDIRSSCRHHLETAKLPRVIKIVEQLPRSPSGKVNKRALATDFT